VSFSSCVISSSEAAAPQSRQNALTYYTPPMVDSAVTLAVYRRIAERKNAHRGAEFNFPRYFTEPGKDREVATGPEMRSLRRQIRHANKTKSACF